MVRILLIESPAGCRKCRETKALLQQLAAARADTVELVIVDTTSPEAARYDLMLTPAVLVGDFVIATGKVPRRDRLEAYLDRLPGAAPPQP